MTIPIISSFSIKLDDLENAGYQFDIYSCVRSLISFFQETVRKCAPFSLLGNFVYSVVSKCSFKTSEK